MNNQIIIKGERQVTQSFNQIPIAPEAVVKSFEVTGFTAWTELHECGQTEASCPLIGPRSRFKDVSGRVCKAVVLTREGEAKGLWCGQTAEAKTHASEATIK